MKKISLYLLLALGCLAAYAGIVHPMTARLAIGNTAPEENFPQQPPTAAVHGNPVSVSSNNAVSFTFDDIKSWAGDGLSRAALVIQWNDSRETKAKVFGYRFNGEVSGYDMLRAIVEEYPYLYAMVQPTDLGYTLNGLGFDNAHTGSFQIKDAKSTYTLDPDKIYNNPGAGYNYDDFSAVNENNYWASGWYTNYWSYWTGTPENFSYSSWGMSNHNVGDGQWYGWNFIPVGSLSGDGDAARWKPFEAVEEFNTNPLTEVTHNGIRYEITNRNINTVSVIQNKSPQYYNVTGTLEIPATFEEGGITYKVTRVGDKAFYFCRATEIILPSTVYYIGNNAFQNTQLMTRLVLPEKLYGIGEMQFNCAYSLTAPIYPEGITKVPAKQFSCCDFKDIALPEFITEIGERAFFDCTKIESLTFDEKHAPYIGSQAFGGCTGLKTVTVTLNTPFEIDENAFIDKNSETPLTATLIVPKGSKEAYASAPGWNKFTDIKDSYVEIEPGTVFSHEGINYRIEEDNSVVVVPYDKDATTYSAIKNANRNGYTGEINIPAEVTYQGSTFSVKAIEPMALAGSGITKLTLADGITLGHHSIAESRVTEVRLPADLRSIPDYAFYYCSALTDINLNEGIVEIGGSAFAYTKVNTAIPSTVTALGGFAFGASAMTEFIQPASLKEISDSLFMKCTALTKAIFNDGTKLGITTLSDCSSLTELRLPADLEILPKYTLNRCKSLTSVTLPQNLKTIGAQALSYLNVETLDIPNTVSQIDSYAFIGCTSLKKIVFPETVTVISSGVCGGCDALEEVVLSDNVTEIESSAFGSRFDNCPSLKKITIIGDETGESRLPSRLEKIGHGAFRGDKVLQVAMSPSIREIAAEAFYECSMMNDFTLPNIETIGHQAFYATALTTFTFPETAKSIGSELFFNCPVKDDLIYTCSNPHKELYSNRYIRPLMKSYAGYPYPAYKLVVPTGHIEDINIISGWGEGVEIIAPELKNLSFGESIAEVIGADVKFTNDFQVTYDMTDIPEIFSRYNNIEALKSYTFEVWYKPAGSSEIEKPITATYDGEKLSASVEGLKPGDYEYYWQYRRGQIPTHTAPAIFTIEKPDPGFSVTVDGAENVDGVYVLEVKKTYKLDVQLTSAESLTYTLVDNEDGAGTYNKWSNAIITNTKEGRFALVVADAADPANSIKLDFEVKIKNHVESITLDGLEDGVLKVKYNTLTAVNPVILPENADITDFTITIDDPAMAKIYAAKAFNPSRNFYELSTFKTGETTVTYTAADGSGVELKFRLIVEDRDREGVIDYTKGVFWINEEWFGHNNGSVNFIDDDYNITYKAYERENPWESFGATSQFATVYGDRLIVMSKQAQDGGDPRPAGGRVVIADAKTLKKIATLTDIGGDGRACVGVSPEKIYLGHTLGIRVLRIDGDNYILDEADIEGIKGKNAYSGQIGDMVKAGGYVFAVQQSTGVHIIDTETDKLVKTIEETAAAGVVQSADGNVWIAAGKKLLCYDPASLELIETREIEQSITCNWGSWKSTNFKAAKKENLLFWGGASIYRWEIGKELPAEPVFALGQREGMNGNNQAQYSTFGYDDATGQLMIATTHGASSNYRYNWYYFIDARTGEINNTQALTPYYWFPAIPVSTDRYQAVISLDDIVMEDIDDPFTVELTKVVTDADDIDSNIRVDISRIPDNIEALIENGQLKVTPITVGEGELVLTAESRGTVTTHNVRITVEAHDGVDAPHSGSRIAVNGRNISAKGYDGEKFYLYDMAGRVTAIFMAQSDDWSTYVTAPAGVYILRGVDRNIKVVIR